MEIDSDAGGVSDMEIDSEDMRANGSVDMSGEGDDKGGDEDEDGDEDGGADEDENDEDHLEGHPSQAYDIIAA